MHLLRMNCMEKQDKSTNIYLFKEKNENNILKTVSENYINRKTFKLGLEKNKTGKKLKKNKLGLELLA